MTRHSRLPTWTELALWYLVLFILVVAALVVWINAAWADRDDCWDSECKQPTSIGCLVPLPFHCDPPPK